MGSCSGRQGRLLGSLLAVLPAAALSFAVSAPALAETGVFINGVRVSPTGEQPVEAVSVRVLAPPTVHLVGGQPVQFLAGDSPRWDPVDHRRRLERLEDDVRVLRSEVANLKSKLGERQPLRETSCLLVTPASGTFSARALTRLEAVGQVLQDCERAKSSGCTETLIRCEESVTPGR